MALEKQDRIAQRAYAIPVSTHCCRFPRDTGWTAVDPQRPFTGRSSPDGGTAGQGVVVVARGWKATGGRPFSSGFRRA